MLRKKLEKFCEYLVYFDAAENGNHGRIVGSKNVLAFAGHVKPDVGTELISVGIISGGENTDLCPETVCGESFPFAASDFDRSDILSVIVIILGGLIEMIFLCLII